MSRQKRRARLRRQIRNAQERDHMNANSVAPPGKGWVLIARRRIASDGMVYNAGCEVPATAAGRNIRALLDSGALWWAPPGTPVAAQPVRLPKPDKPRPKPVIEIVTIPNDVAASWRATLDLMTERCGSLQAAEDLLLSDPAARDLCKLATAVACSKESAAQKRVSVSPSILGL